MLKDATMPLRLTKEELDKQFQQFLKESLSDDSVDFGNLQWEAGAAGPSSTPKVQKTAAKTRPWWDDDDDDGGGPGAGRIFRKSLRKSEPVQEKQELSEAACSLRTETYAITGDDAHTKDLSQNTPIEESSPMMEMSPGLDTLEEQEEKARFFAQIEAEASSTIDYSKLNRELDSTGSTFGSKLRRAEVVADESDEGESKVKFMMGSVSPVSLNYSEDFEEENDEEVVKQNAEKSPVPSKGLSNVLSGGSEMEAVHEAYRQISHAEEDLEDRSHQQQHDSSLEEKGSTLLPSHPQPVTQSLQPASTTESDLPTAEELMKTIRPENQPITGFTLQPASASHLDQGGTTSSDSVTSPQSNVHQLGLTEGKEAEELARDLPGSPDLTTIIKEEVERLMRDQTKLMPDRQSYKPVNQQAALGSTVSHHSPPPVRKPPAIRARTAGPSRAAAPAPAKPKSAAPKTVEHSVKTMRSNKKVAGKELALHTDTMAPHPSRDLISQQQDSYQPEDETEVWDDTVPEETTQPHSEDNFQQDDDNSEVQRLRIQLAQKEKKLQLMKHQTEELTSLRQQNYVLQSKLRSTEERIQNRKWIDSATTITDEKLQAINKEIQQQENLIKGYQQENEKLYQEIKEQRRNSKAVEEAMFHKNQELLRELAKTKEQMNRIPTHIVEVESAQQSKINAELQAQVASLQRQEAKLFAELQHLRQENETLQVNLQRAKQERETAVKQGTSIADLQRDLRLQKERYDEEVEALKKKVQFCADNHQQVGKTNQVKRGGDQQKRTKDRLMDNLKVQSLEQQVKKLQNILRDRNPNSLPALIYAAASADTERKSSINQLLEQRVERLEAELEEHDEQAKLRLKSLQEQYHLMKCRYEQRISELEEQSKQTGPEAGVQTLLSQVQQLKEELQTGKEIQKRKEKSLQDQIESLQQQIDQKARLTSAPNQAEASQIEQLKEELAAKNQMIQTLSRAVESRNVSSVATSHRRTSSRERDREPAPAEAAAPAPRREEMMPSSQYSKTYQPNLYTGSHVTEVIQEREALRQQFALLKRHSEEEKKALIANIRQSEDELRSLKEKFAEQLSSMKVEHLKVLDRQRVTSAVEHSSKVNELQKKINSQEIVIKHYQEQLTELQQREKDIAREQAENPQMKLLCCLERKIDNLELKHQKRVESLQKVIDGSQQMLGVDQKAEVERWKSLVQVKRRELETFYLELDYILDLVRQLYSKQQVLPS